MNPIDWLNQKAPGFAELSQEEKDAIMHFSLLWSFFEAKALNTSGSSTRIIALVREWARSGRLQPDFCAESLEYFRNRYVENGEFTCFFDGLHLR